MEALNEVEALALSQLLWHVLPLTDLDKLFFFFSTMLVKDEEAIFGYSDHAVVVELQTDKATDELIVAFVVHNTFKDLVDTDLRIFCDHSEVVIVPP